MQKEFDYMKKIICVGDASCGKTSLITRFTKGVFQSDYKLTIGCDFFVKTVVLPKGTLVKLRLWDMGGEERFDYLRNVYYKGAEGVVIAFDLTNEHSFEHLSKWIDQVHENLNSIPIFIAGNKRDLTNQRRISYEEALQYAQQHNAKYIETSAKDGDGVEELFIQLSQNILEPTLKE